MNNNGVLSQPELVKVTTIEESYRGIKSAKDVEYFTALTWLNLDGNQLSSVDVSHNTALDHLYLSNNRLLWIGGVAESADPDLSG